MKYRLKIGALILVLLSFSLLTTQQAQAGGLVSIGSQISNGCGTAQSFFNIKFNVPADGTSHSVVTLVTASGNTFMDEEFTSDGNFFSAKTVWGLFDENTNGKQTANFPMPANTPITVSIALDGSVSSIVFQCSSFFSGPPIPPNFVLRPISCTTAVFDTPGGNPVPDRVIKSGQTWYVSPDSVKDAKGKLWTGVFVSSFDIPFIPTECAFPSQKTNIVASIALLPKSSPLTLSFGSGFGSKHN